MFPRGIQNLSNWRCRHFTSSAVFIPAVLLAVRASVLPRSNTNGLGALDGSGTTFHITGQNPVPCPLGTGPINLSRNPGGNFTYWCASECVHSIQVINQGQFEEQLIKFNIGHVPAARSH